MNIGYIYIIYIYIYPIIFHDIPMFDGKISIKKHPNQAHHII